jgi:uncharacterized protein YjiK
MILTRPHLAVPLASMLLCTAAFAQAETVRTISQYTLLRGPISIAGVEDDLSGITSHADSGALLVILNDPPTLLTLDKNLQVTRSNRLTGFDDTEDLCHVKGERFAVVEERRRNICEFDLPIDNAPVVYRDAVKTLIEKEEFGNKGLEGVTYIPARDEFIIVKEKKPMRIYALSRTSLGEADPEIRHPWNAVKHSQQVVDLSALHFDTASGHLLLLSHESKSVTEVTLEGEKVAVLSLKAGRAGLKGDIPQAEGITMGKNGHLYIVSEPNLIYEFVRE